MPTRVAVHLARTYLEDTRRLEERFGGYASFWRYCAERLAEDPPEEEFVPYPLWELPIEGGPANGGEAPVIDPRWTGIQSVPLSSFGALR